MDITLDSNVLVYAFVPPIHKNEMKRKEWENLHINARKIYENVIREEHCLILPFAVIMEVASVISLLTGKEEYGKDAALEIMDSANDKPCPSALLLGFIDGIPCHVVVA
jgi:predicted nucleic acid-binding protein